LKYSCSGHNPNQNSTILHITSDQTLKLIYILETGCSLPLQPIV
jgi:hypothetical protein